MFPLTPIRLLLPVFSVFWVLSTLIAGEALRVRVAPKANAETVAMFEVLEGIEIVRIVDGWAEIRLGMTLGWTRVENLLEHLRPGQEPPRVADFHLSHPSQEPASERNALADLLDFSFGDTELEQKMTHPHFRHSVTDVSTEWGPLFRYKTPYYSWRGIHLFELWKDRLRLNLVKGKENYTETFGPTWSGAFQDIIVESNRGLLSNRNFFGRGRNVFLELRYSF